MSLVHPIVRYCLARKGLPIDFLKPNPDRDIILWIHPKICNFQSIFKAQQDYVILVSIKLSLIIYFSLFLDVLLNLQLHILSFSNFLLRLNDIQFPSLLMIWFILKFYFIVLSIPKYFHNFFKCCQLFNLLFCSYEKSNENYLHFPDETNCV